MKTFTTVIILFCFIYSSMAISQEKSIKKQSWKHDTSFLGKNIKGTAINIFACNNTYIVPIFDKNSGNIYSLVKFAKNDWKEINAATWGNIVVEDKAIIMAHIHSFENRKKWEISRISFDKSMQISRHEVASYPDARYVHHTSVAKTSDQTLYAMAGIYKRNDNFYQLLSSNNGGKSWTMISDSPKGFSAHDDVPTVFKSFANHLLFFGFRSNRKDMRKYGGKLMARMGGSWVEISLPHKNVWLMNFQESENLLHVVYGIKKEQWQMDMYYTSTTDLKSWSKPILLFKNLKMEDVLMQMPPKLLAMKSNLLISFADIHGRWTRGEYVFRFFASNDRGKSWSEFDTQKSLGKVAHISFLGNKEEVLATIGRGSFRKMSTEVWRLVKAK